MQQKIVDYVNYQFRFDQRENVEAIKQEMIVNLTDRFQDLVDQGLDEKAAYIETVKRLGHIEETIESQVNPLYIEKPTRSLIAMITVSVLAIGGLVLSVISNLVGLIVTLGSVGVFATASYALYADSQHKRAIEYDIDCQKTYFKSIMKTFNQNYVIWSLTVAIVFSGVVLNLIFMVSSDNLSEIILAGNLNQVILVYFLLWFFSFSVLFAILRSLQGILYQKYIHITGDSSRSNQLRKTHHFKHRYELILFLYVLLTTLIFWASPISYILYSGGGMLSLETTFIAAISDFPFLSIPTVMSFLMMIWMAFNLKTTKVSRWLLFLLTTMTYIAYLFTVIMYQYQLPGTLEVNLTLVAVFLMVSLLAHFLYVIFLLTRKE